MHKNADPTIRSGNKPPLKRAIVLAATVLALAGCGETPVEAENFDSYAQASDRIEQLVLAHENERNTSPEVTRDIKESLKGALPQFKAEVATKVNDIFAHTGTESATTDPDSGITYRTHSFTDDDGNEVRELMNTQQIHGLNTENRLYVTTTETGDREVNFSQRTTVDPEISDTEDGYYSNHTLLVDSEGALEAHSYMDYDGDFDTNDDKSSGFMRFDGNDFAGHTVFYGPALNRAYEEMQETLTFVDEFKTATIGE